MEKYFDQNNKFRSHQCDVALIWADFDMVKTAVDDSFFIFEGYIIYRKMFDIQDSTIEELKKYKMQRRAGIIFNKDEFTDKMTESVCNVTWIVRVDGGEHHKLKLWNPNTQCVWKWRFEIQQLDNSTFQKRVVIDKPNTDYVVDEQFTQSKWHMRMKITRDSIPLFSFKISVMPNTYLHVWEKSIGLTTKKGQDLKQVEKISGKKN